MTTRNEPWPTGRPAWVDLMVPDRHAARDFYSALFGWEYEESGPDTGYYTQASKDGHKVAGFGEPLPGQEGQPSQWVAYLAADDAQAVTDAAEQAGATVVVAPMDVMEFGRMAILADPTGAVVGLWQSGTHTGYQLVDEPGSVVWTEQMSRDLDRAKSFFADVFGYTYTDVDAGGMKYVTFELDGQTAGGLGEMPEGMDGVPPHWLTYFGVEDVDAAAATVTEKGGSVLREPFDTQWGRIAVVAGHVGEAFALMAPAQPADAEA